MNKIINVSIFDGSILASGVPSSGVDVVVSTNEADRRSLAEDLGILDVEHLDATVTAKPWRKTGVRLDGVIRAAVRQSCVVTLEPVPENISTTFAVRLLPEQELATLDDTDEIVIDPDEVIDPPEPFINGKIDVGAIVCEHIALELNPYPRLEGQVFVGSSDGEENSTVLGRTSGAFAALNGLKKNN